MKLNEIAKRITEHLKRFESDPVINPVGTGLRRVYYNAYASDAGSKIRIKYVSYQGGTCLSKSDALEYLAWLDAGNIGTHYYALSFNARINRG